MSGLLNLEPDTVFRLQGFVVALVILGVVERFLPARRQGDYGITAARVTSNIQLQLINIVILLAIPISLSAAALYALFNQLGLFNIELLDPIHLGLWSKIFFCWVVMDLFMYWLHFAYHKIGFLWRIHRVHHSDLLLDVSTTFRTHPLETLITIAVKALLVVVLGMPLLGVITYEVIVASMALIIHGNIRLSGGLDKILRWVIVTPAMHRVHHGSAATDYQSNFGLVLSIWDRIFGSYREEASEIQMGIPELYIPDQQKLLPLLGMPLK